MFLLSTDDQIFNMIRVKYQCAKGIWHFKTNGWTTIVQIIPDSESF